MAIGDAPGVVLNIGPGANQNHFAVQIAPTNGSAFQTHTMAEIAAGYSDPEHFYTTPDGLWVAFRPRADGATTSGTTYARDELRETDASGANIKFDALVGEHILQGRSKIVYVPNNDPDVVIAQLHNGDADRIAIRTQMFSNGTVVLGVRINGSLHATRFQNPFVLGSEFDWKIRLINGTAEIYYNNMVTPLITSTALVQTTHPDGWYWKTGAYNQFNEVDTGATGLTVSASEYSEVHLRNLQVTHPGGPASASASFSGSGTLTSSVVVNRTASGSFSGSGTLSSTRTVGASRSVSLSGSGTLTAASNGKLASASLSGSGTLAATVTNVGARVNHTQYGVGQLSGTAAQALAALVTLSGNGALSHSVTIATSITGTLSGEGTLTSVVRLNRSVSASLSGIGVLSLAVVVPRDADHSGELAEARWRGTIPKQRWLGPVQDKRWEGKL